MKDSTIARDDGGPAFPVHDQWNEWSDLKADYVPKTGPRGGMSLRDYFAGQLVTACGETTIGETEIQILVARAYRIADAMIAERAR